MAQRLRISLKPKPALTMRRVALEHERLVYVICADRKLKYENGYSQIAYIGTTRNGITRVASSAAHRSWDVLWAHGVQSFDVRIAHVPATARLQVLAQAGTGVDPRVPREVRRAANVQCPGPRHADR